ncbi:hypothetical protein [Scytonema sp. PCC 10023]
MTDDGEHKVGDRAERSALVPNRDSEQRHCQSLGNTRRQGAE